MSIARKLKTFVPLGLGLLVLTSCVVEEGPYTPRPSVPRACIPEYKPVCAERDGERRTFNNVCYAHREGYKVVYEDQCRYGWDPRPWPAPGPTPPPPPPPPAPPPQQMCTMEYRPVCGERYGQRRTFNNKCLAENEGFRVLYNGQCVGTRLSSGMSPGFSPGFSSGFSSGMSRFSCDVTENRPVCAERLGHQQSFRNACQAERFGYKVIYEGDCQR